MYCGKCGAQIPDGYEYCMKCGTKLDKQQLVSENQTIANNASVAKSENKKVNRKVLIALAAVIATVIAVVALVAVFFGDNNSAEKEGYFANIPWGLNIETTKKMADEAFADHKPGLGGEDGDTFYAFAVEDYDGMKGVCLYPSFEFTDNKFDQVRTNIFFDDECDFTLDEVAEKFVDKYNKYFGKYEMEDTYMGKAYTWISKKSIIQLIVRPLDDDDTIFIRYKPITE